MKVHLEVEPEEEHQVEDGDGELDSDPEPVYLDDESHPRRNSIIALGGFLSAFALVVGFLPNDFQVVCGITLMIVVAFVWLMQRDRIFPSYE